MSRFAPPIGFLLALVLHGACGFADVASDVVRRAEKVVNDNPTAANIAGIIHLASSDRRLSTELDAAKLLALLPVIDLQSRQLREWLCWRQQPLGAAGRDRFNADLAALEAVRVGGDAPGPSPWSPVFRLCLAVIDRDRDAMLALADVKAPGAFPSAFADRAAVDLLASLLESSHAPRVDAGLHVLAHRDFIPLHALTDLDRGLTREARFLRSIDRPADAGRLEACRDRLRAAYLKASAHTVERLFALNLLGQTAERDQLLGKQAAWNDEVAQFGGLAVVASRLTPDEQWTQLVEPTLAGDLALIENPPRWLLDLRKGDLTTLVRIEADQRQASGARVDYKGNVTVTLGGVRMTCEHVAAVRATVAGKPRVTIAGKGGLEIRISTGTLRADAATITTDPPAIEVAGHVRIEHQGRVVKYEQAAFTLTGGLLRHGSHLDDWRNAKDIAARLALLPKIAETYEDDELPDDARYLLALRLAEGQMSWHAPFSSSFQGGRAADQIRRRRGGDDWRWGEAMGREAWMTVPQETVEACRAALDSPRLKPDAAPTTIAPADACHWRLLDPAHESIARAIRLLDGIRDVALRPQAARWAAELRRNNTVLTFDIPGGFASGMAGKVVMDARNADDVAFSLYRVKKPAELQAFAGRIGDDFIYRDDVPVEAGLEKVQELWKLQQELAERRSDEEVRLPLPALKEVDLVEKWTARIADLPSRGPDWRDSVRRWRYEDWDEGDADADFFGDDSDRHRARVAKDYRPRPGALSSWRTDRVVTIPARALKDPGAYVLVATANGVRSHVPIVVDPLSLTLRRCRDGVFVMAADAGGRFPLVDAQVSAAGALRDEATDRRGVAFLRVHAAGDLPIIVHQEGRWAIGGFGRVFDGIYEPWWTEDDRPWRFPQKDRLRRAERERQALAQVYDDRSVIVAYADRPTYRPGQTVNFKLILREFAGGRNAGGAAGAVVGFRAEEFDLAGMLSLPKAKEPLRWEVLNPRGRIIESGTAAVSDFGTAIGTVVLNEESQAGSYAMRVSGGSGGMVRIVPDVFAVKHYRRPNFEIKLEGVPALATGPAALTLQVTGRYYFGLPVTAGLVDVRLVRVDQWRPLAQATAPVNTGGGASMVLDLPVNLDSERYAVIATLTDASGRSVSVSRPLEYRAANQVAGTSSLPALPRFVALGQDLVVRTPRREVTATVSGGAESPETTDQVFLAKDGAATIKLTRAGWNRIQSGDEHIDVFAYGTEDSAIATLPPWEAAQPAGADDARWVNLTDYAEQEQAGFDRHDDPRKHLYAMFERRHAVVGDKLRVLVFCPLDQPRLLLTIEGRTVMDYIDVTVPAKAGRYHVIEVPIKAHYGPNFYLQGRVLAGAPTREQPRREVKPRPEVERGPTEESDDGSADPRWCRVEVIDPARKATGERLTVKVETDRGPYKPGEEVNVRIAVTDMEGKPREAELSLAAVDESVFSFGEDALHSLAASLGGGWAERRYQPKAWRASIGATWSRQEMEKVRKAPAMQLEKLQEMARADRAKELIRSVAPGLDRESDRSLPLADLGGKLPVTALDLAPLRGDFRETAAWLPQLRTDARGLAQGTFRLPDSLTAYRLTAVGVTRGTEMGVGRSALSVSLPVSVQVFLPRFAIEKDRLQASALIHNGGEAARTCVLRWEVKGAGCEPVEDGWKRGEAAGRVTYEREVMVPPRGSTRVALRLLFDEVGAASVACRVADRDRPADADAEERTLAVSPMGRPVEHVFSGVFQGGEHRLNLPAGFVASDLTVSVARGDVTHAMEGLGYLVEYPYGCVEQTMSRFLPAVMVKHAAKRGAVAFPASVEAKLQDVLAKGLERLYGFQHEDGGFGWFQRDGRDDAMTVYVMYGLARCASTGVKVDAGALRRGGAYLQARLRDGAMSERDAARAWYVLALAGLFDADEVERAAKKLLDADAKVRAGGGRAQSGADMMNLALACREAGRRDTAERLWRAVRDRVPLTTAELALMLAAQSAFGEPVDACYATAGQLLARRQGHRWADTRETSWAIEALAELVGYSPPPQGAAGLAIHVGGKRVLEVKKNDARAAAVERVRLRGGELSSDQGVEIVIQADGKGPFHFAVTATGVERLEHAQPRGEAVRITRRYETLEGKAIQGPVKVGQVIAARVTVETVEDQAYVIVEDRRPAGLEFADDRMRTGEAAAPAEVEFRDDRVCAFFPRLSAGRHEMIYYLRAESVGVNHVLPGCVYPMYADTMRGETGTQRVEIE